MNQRLKCLVSPLWPVSGLLVPPGLHSWAGGLVGWQWQGWVRGRKGPWVPGTWGACEACETAAAVAPPCTLTLTAWLHPAAGRFPSSAWPIQKFGPRSKRHRGNHNSRIRDLVCINHHPKPLDTFRPLTDSKRPTSSPSKKPARSRIQGVDCGSTTRKTSPHPAADRISLSLLPSLPTTHPAP